MHVGLVSLTDIDYGLDLANALNERGTSVTLYMSRSHTARAVGDSVRPAERIFEIGLLLPTVGLRLFTAPRMRNLGSLAVMWKLRQTLLADEIDVVHLLVGSGEIWLAVLAWLLCGVPVCSTMIIPKPNVGDYPSAPIVFGVNQLLAWGSDIIVVNGAEQVRLVQKMYRLASDRVHYVPLIPRVSPLHWATKKVTEEPGLILFFGRVDKHKGVEYLVRAQPFITQHIEGAHIVIAGQGPEFGRCRQLMADLSSFELHEGFVSNDLVAELFQRAAVVVLPYLSASTSAVLMTAQVFGKPVVATLVGCLPEYLEDGITGFLVPPANEEKLASAIVELLQNNKLRHQMGENAFSRVDKVRDECVRQTMSALEKAISRH